MPTYGWLTQTQAVQALHARLNNSQQWTVGELWVYLSEGLRILNSLTEQWNQDWAVPNATGDWINSGTTMTSPRVRTRTSNDLFTQMQYMLLEPASGGTWTGSSQFDIDDLSVALQRRIQEVIQTTACNLGLLSLINALPNTRRYALGDTVLEPRRIRFIPAAGFGNPFTLSREDTQAFQYFEPDYLQTNAIPQAWSVASEPPLSFDVDTSPDVAGQWEVLALTSGPDFTPPAAALLGIPDDWSWLPLYGALADILSKDPESTDRARAAYCLQRYTQGLEVMKNSNWLLQATVNNIPVDTPSVFEMDQWAPEWEEATGNLPAVIQAGIDFVAPTPGAGQSITLTLVGNAPLLDGGFVQVSRDDFEGVLNYAQHLACFKHGNQEFQGTVGLLEDFFRATTAENQRTLNRGLYTTVLKTEGQRQELEVAR
jgi:hypothetical protein